jgi:HNH endonuclease
MLFAQEPTTSLDIPPKLILLLVAVALFAAIGKALEARAGARRREARKQRQREYRQYLRSEGWKLRRQVALDRAGGFCEDCGARESFEVHHRTYKRKGNERPEDLVAVCRRCHKERHRGKRTLLDLIVLALVRRWRIWRYRGANAS